MGLIVLFTIFGLVMIRLLGSPRGSWRYVVGAGIASALATQLLPSGHPLRADVAESGRNLGWLALALVPVAVYAFGLRKLRRRTGVDTEKRGARAKTTAASPRGLVQIAEDAALTAETEVALAHDVTDALGHTPRKWSLAWRAEDGQIAGHLRFTLLGETSEIVALRVREPYRGTGIGAALVRGAEEMSRESGARRMCMRVGSWQDAGFGERLGYDTVRKREIGLGASWLWMEKDLT